MPGLLRYVGHSILFLALLGNPPADAETSYTTVTSKILALCDTCQVLILGETHQHPESPALFLDLVMSLIVRGNHILVGLEIPTARQEALDMVMAKQRTPAGLAPAMIDSPAYQAMLMTLARLHQAHGSRVAVVAIDELTPDTPRDRAMAMHLRTRLVTGRYDRAVVVVGNLHAIRRMRWAKDAWSPQPFLAERLINAGLRVTSVMQSLDSACEHPRQPTFFPITEQGGLAAVCRRVAVAKIHPEMDVRKAADGVVLWQCQEQEK
jgi:hypothetical protein